MLDVPQRHDPGMWKQKNKAHHSLGHRSKREINAQNKGSYILVFIYVVYVNIAIYSFTICELQGLIKSHRLTVYTHLEVTAKNMCRL